MKKLIFLLAAVFVMLVATVHAQAGCTLTVNSVDTDLQVVLGHLKLLQVIYPIGQLNVSHQTFNFPFFFACKLLFLLTVKSNFLE